MSATSEQKNILLTGFEDYVKKNFVDVNLKDSTDSLKTVTPLANSLILEAYAQAMTDIKTKNMSLEEANTLLKSKELIDRNLEEKEFRTLVKGFNVKVYNELMGIIIDKTKDAKLRQDIKDNQKLVGLGEQKKNDEKKMRI